jgi:ribosomal protein L17
VPHCRPSLAAVVAVVVGGFVVGALAGGCDAAPAPREARLPASRDDPLPAEPGLRKLLGERADVQATPPLPDGAFGRLTSAGAQITVDSLDVRVTVAGRMARTEVTQVFRNHAGRQLEGTYAFQLPDGASIARLAMDVDGKMTEGELVERDKARAIYQSIVNARKDPALLEWDGGNRFTTRIFPIPASGTKTVILAYEQLLPQEGRLIRYRYSLPKLVGQPGAANLGRFTFALSSLDAESGDVRGLPGTPGGKPLQVAFAQEAFVPDGPVDVDLRGPLAESRAWVATHATSTGKGAERAVTQAFLIDWVPEAEGVLDDEGDLVLAFDTSASVGDVEWARARAVGRLLATQAGKDRQVRVVYGDVRAWRCPGDAVGGPEAAAFVDRCVGERAARGASDVGLLLGTALDVAGGMTRPRVVLLGDGVASLGQMDADLLVAGTRASAHAAAATVHTVAVGHAPDVDLLRLLARAGRGHAVRLRPDDVVDAVAETMHHLLRVPVIDDVRAEVTSGEVSELVVPATAVARGEPAAVLGRLKGSSATLRLQARLGDKALVRDVELKSTGDENGLVVRAWARARMGERVRNREPQPAIVADSIRYGVMSPFTSFLVLENEAMYANAGIDRRKREELATEAPKTAESFRKGSESLQARLRVDTSADEGGGGDAKGAPADSAILPAPRAAAPTDALRALAAPPSVPPASAVAAPSAVSPSVDEAARPGAGGAPAGSIGTLGNRGAGGGGVASGKGIGDLDRRPSPDPEVAVTQGMPVILGSLDPEIIRRIVRSHAGQIRFCYEHELRKTPGIRGKIVMKWIINGEGRVMQAQVAETQMRNADVESCLAARIKTWTFPKPKGGGVVVINYPFVFKSDELSENSFQPPPSRPTWPASPAGWGGEPPATGWPPGPLVTAVSPLRSLRADFAAVLERTPPGDGPAPPALVDAAVRLAGMGGLDRATVDALAARGAWSVPDWLRLLRAISPRDRLGLQRSVVAPDVAAGLLRLVRAEARTSDGRPVDAGADLTTVSWTRPMLLALLQSGQEAFATRAAAHVEALLAAPGNEAVLVEEYLRHETQAGRGAAADKRVLDACLAGRIAGAVCYERFANNDLVGDVERLLMITLARREDVENARLTTSMVDLLKKMGAPAEAERVQSEWVEFSPRSAQRRQQYFDLLRTAGRTEDACAQGAAVVQLEPQRRDMFKTMMNLAREKPETSPAVRRCIVEGVSMLPVRRAISLILTWDDPTADIDLYVEEAGASGDPVYYAHRESPQGGLLYYDVRDGLGPEIYALGAARPGTYRVGLQYYRGNAVMVPATLTILENAGAPDETRRELDVTVFGGSSDPQWVAEVDVPAPSTL